MIIKKIESGTIASKAGYVERLTNYFLQPQKTKQHEKVLYVACRGFICEDIQGAQAEMSAMADGAKSSHNSSLHLVMSWKEGEQPTPDQVDEAVRLLMNELGLDGHGVIYALHLDTDNLHCHLAISRVQPETERVIAANRGFDLEAIHRAIARIEHAQGWERETHGRYQVLDNGQLIRYGTSDSSIKRPRQPRQDMEHRTGAKSVQRLAIEKAGPVIAAASNWDELHQRLASQGMRYVKSGSGAVVFVGDIAVKASSINRNASLTRVQKRLGPYRPSTVVMAPGAQDTSPPLLPVEPATRRWHTYIQERQAFYNGRDQARRQLQKEQDAARKVLLAQQRVDRQEILKGDWKQMGLARMALRSILAQQHAAQKINLKLSHQTERLALKTKFAGFPGYETWLRQGQYGDDANAWRYRHSQWPCLKGTANISGTDTEPAQPKDIRAFQAYALGDEVHYVKSQVAAGLQNVAFIDRGNQIDICDAQDDDAILAAMQLAAQKWGSFEIEGSAAFQRRCVALAAQNGIRIANPELQEPLAAVRQQLRQDVKDTEHWPAMTAWAPYFLAMQAPRYRITTSHERGDGTIVTERMTSVTGSQTSMTVADMIQTKQKMNGALEGRQLNQSTTIEPVFSDKMAFRITDISEARLNALLQAGFEARVVMEVEPGRFELLLTVPLAGLQHARQTIVNWGQLMKAHYEVEIELCSQDSIGHAMPGFASSKSPGHTISVRTSKGQDCAKSLNMISAIDIAMEREFQETTNNDELNRQAQIELADERQRSPTEIAFAAHRADICKHAQGMRVDASRIDAQVALRLKMVGHDREDVAAALILFSKQHASKNVERDWCLYAHRATAYAWGPAGRRQESVQGLQLQKWDALERTLAHTPVSPRLPPTTLRH